jgi:hypothetical protein
MQLLDRDRLANSTDVVKNTIDIVWSAYRSILSKEEGLAYVSTAITSGRLMYEQLDKHGFADADELKAKAPTVLFDSIIKPNIEAGTAVARLMARKIDHPVVAPAVFEARKQRWSQDEYMAMWLKMIEENVARIYMAPGWEYSNGGAEEFLHAAQMSLGYRSRCTIEILDSEDKPIRLHDGLVSIGRALLDLRQRKRKAPVLADVCAAAIRLRGVEVAKRVTDPHRAYNRGFSEAVMANREVIDSFKEDLKPMLVDDYGITDVFKLPFNMSSGLPRSNDATPEGIILKAEEPPTE